MAGVQPSQRDAGAAATPTASFKTPPRPFCRGWPVMGLKRPQTLEEYAIQHLALLRVWGATKKRADRLKPKFGLDYAQAEVERQAQRGNGRDMRALRALARSAGLPSVDGRKYSFRALCTEE